MMALKNRGARCENSGKSNTVSSVANNYDILGALLFACMAYARRRSNYDNGHVPHGSSTITMAFDPWRLLVRAWLLVVSYHFYHMASCQFLQPIGSKVLKSVKHA